MVGFSDTVLCKGLNNRYCVLQVQENGELEKLLTVVASSPFDDSETELCVLRDDW